MLASRLQMKGDPVHRTNSGGRGLRSTWARSRCALAACGWVAAATATPVTALEYQVHGFASGGLVSSEGYDYYGDSTSGSIQYYEAGLNGIVQPLPSLLFSVQGVARDAGATDDGKPRLDYAFFDYAFSQNTGHAAGVRLGRVKIPFGFYNETRDVVFTRPGIVLPSTYNDAAGARTLLFAGDGIQGYGATDFANHYASVAVTVAPERKLSDTEARRLGAPGNGDILLEDLVSARLLDEWDGGRWSAGLSYLSADLSFEQGTTRFDIDFQLYVASLAYRAERFAITTEYSRTRTTTDFAFGATTGTVKSDGDGIYLQGEFFLDPQWTLLARYDARFEDRGDRAGTECSRSGAPVDAGVCFAHDYVAGVNWKSQKNWGVWAEYHWTLGTATVSRLDNDAAPQGDAWSMLLVMAGYRF